MVSIFRYIGRDFEKGIGCQLTEGRRDGDVAGVFVPDEFSHFEDQLRECVGDV
jgi:hypothetical protein